MSEIINEIKNILEISQSEKIVIFTNHLKVIGNVKLCDICNTGHFLNLTNAIAIPITDLYDCETEKTCDEIVCQKFKWLHVNAKKILAFSIID